MNYAAGNLGNLVVLNGFRVAQAKKIILRQPPLPTYSSTFGAESGVEAGGFF